MDLDALARDLAERYMRCDFSAPPFPAYHAAWEAKLRAQTPDEDIAAMLAALPPIESVEPTDQRRFGDLDMHVYRVEPGESALLLGVRGGELAYVSFVGALYSAPEEGRGHDFPFRQLAMFAISARAEGEAGVSFAGLSFHDGAPAHIAVEVDREAYESMDDAARSALQQACIPIARDAALLTLDGHGYTADQPLVLGFYGSQVQSRDGTGSVVHIDGGRGRPEQIDEITVS